MQRPCRSRSFVSANAWATAETRCAAIGVVLFLVVAAAGVVDAANDDDDAVFELQCRERADRCGDLGAGSLLAPRCRAALRKRQPACECQRLLQGVDDRSAVDVVTAFRGAAKSLTVGGVADGASAVALIAVFHVVIDHTGEGDPRFAADAGVFGVEDGAHVALTAGGQHEARAPARRLLLRRRCRRRRRRERWRR